MRIGFNPIKEDKEIVLKNYHRIIVPVYIPNQEGYFKDSFEILKLNIESLLTTIHDKTRITIYNNNSISIVKNYIDDLYQKHQAIDQVFHSKENLGKINAILAGVKGNLEPLITITDSDVFFKHDWQKEVEQTFINFPNAGMISPTPSSKTIKSFTATNWYFGILGGMSMQFEDVQDPTAMKKFDDSLGNPTPIYSQAHLDKYLVLKSKKGKAVMGCGHFVATLRREVFDKGSDSPAFIKIVGGVENKFIDIPNESLGFLRLATLGNYTYHLGNVKELWMEEEFELLKTRKPNVYAENNELFVSKPLPKWKIKIGMIFRKLLLSNFFKNGYFRNIGLTAPENYSL